MMISPLVSPHAILNVTLKIRVEKIPIISLYHPRNSADPLAGIMPERDIFKTKSGKNFNTIFILGVRVWGPIPAY